jgi:hypothetical protein
LGEIFFSQKDENTARSLFTVALTGFTYMDVHQSRAECMLRLGDIYHVHSDNLNARELWQTTMLLFERSSRAKEVQCVDERLACIDRNVLEHYRENLGHPTELNVPSSKLSTIQDEEPVEMVDETLEQVVA